MAKIWVAEASAEQGRFAVGGSVREAWYRRYVIVLAVLLTATVLVATASLPALIRTAPVGFWVLAAMAVVADTPIVTIRRPSAPPVVMTSVTFCYTISYAYGHGSGRLIQATAILVAAAFSRRRAWPTAFDLGRYGLALAAAGTVATAFGRPVSTPSHPVSLLGVLVAALTWYLTFRLLTATGTWMRDGGTWTRALTRDLPGEAVSAAALLLLSPMLILLVYYDPWLIPLILAPIFAVSQMARLSAQQQQRALHDPLTGLPNRQALAQASQEPIRQCADPHADVGIAALAILDIAQLGRVNDVLGHGVGDKIVAAIGRKLASLADAHTLVARLQSDEFAVFVSHLASVEEVLARTAAVRAQFDKPVRVNGQPLTMSASVGISLCPVHGTDFDTLARRADIAMERAKSLPDPTVIFQFEQGTPTPDLFALLADLDRALDDPDNTEIVPFYQPQVDLATGQLVGVEALLRWRHPTRGMVGPEEVMRVAEHSPVMRKISIRMLDQVLAQLVAWRSEGRPLHASVNVSVRDLHSDELVKWLQARLRHYSLPPSQIQLELTESALVSQPFTVLRALQYLRGLGVDTSLDDFGTGFSSLTHLRQFPLSEVKIDKSFVRSMMDSPQDEAIVHAVIDLGRDLGLRVVAEGVEDDRTRLRLLALGCHLAQGWYFAAPMPANELLPWLTCANR